MDEAFEPLPANALVFRLATRGPGFLPKGALLPDPLWFRPTSEDVTEAAARDRVPGLSMWERARTTVPQARKLSAKHDGEAFASYVGELLKVGEDVNISLAVVRDPLYEEAPAPGWDGHVVLEGVHRPSGESKNDFRRLREGLASACSPFDG